MTPASLSLVTATGACSCDDGRVAERRRRARIRDRRVGRDLAAVLGQGLVEQVDIDDVGGDEPELPRLALHGRVTRVLGLLVRELLPDELGAVQRARVRVHLTPTVGSLFEGLVHGRVEREAGYLRRRDLGVERVHAGAHRVDHDEGLLGDHRDGVGALCGLVTPARHHELEIDVAPVGVRTSEDTFVGGQRILERVRDRAGLVGRIVRRRPSSRQCGELLLVGDERDDLDRVGGDAAVRRTAVVLAGFPFREAHRAGFGGEEFEAPVRTLVPDALRVRVRGGRVDPRTCRRLAGVRRPLRGSGERDRQRQHHGHRDEGGAARRSPHVAPRAPHHRSPLAPGGPGRRADRTDPPAALSMGACAGTTCHERAESPAPARTTPGEEP